TEFKRDAYGNVVVQIDYGRGSANATESSATPQGSFLPWLDNDRKTYTQYDSHGHAVMSTDAEGINHFTSYNARGQVAKRWQAVMGNDGNKHTLFQAFQYDALGQLTHTLDPASTTQLIDGQHV